MILKISWLGILVLIICLIPVILYSLPGKKINVKIVVNLELLSLSERLLESVKREEPFLTTEKVIADFDTKGLKEGLPDDAAKKAFWINIYNAWYQILAVREQMKRPEIFTKKAILIAGIKFSLDDMEHGILRRYRWKYSMGYFPAFFPGELIKQLAVSTIDYRIHFALNCGAKSCPPILFYSYENIENQLDLATRSFLLSETEIDDIKKEVRVSKILDWFRGDFSGTKGIQHIVGGVFLKDLSGYKIKFKPYDWAEKLHYFS